MNNAEFLSLQDMTNSADSFFALFLADHDRHMFYLVCMCVISFWLLLEVIFFFVVYYYLLPGLQKLTKPQAYPTCTIQFMKRIISSVNDIECYTFEKYVEGFFRGAKFEEVYQDNFRSFLAWAMYGKQLNNLTETQHRDIMEVSEYAAQVHPIVRKVKPGFNPNIKHCCMTYEPIPTIHRPLLTYVIVAMMEAAANTLFLRMRGFQSLEINGMTYWYRKRNDGYDSRSHTSTGSTGEEPLVFLHGIATGWMLYLQIAKAMGSNRTLILIDLDAIKIKSMTFKMPTPQQFVESFRQVLDRHRIPRASVVGHSFGSITAGWLVTNCPDRVSHLTLLDPVSMLLSFPEVSYSFLYRPPAKITEWIIYLMASRELTISHTLHRHFWWYNNNLWLEDVPAHIGVVVGIATHDEIINPMAVHQYVRHCAQKRLEQCQGVSKDSSSSNSVAAVNMARMECLVWDGFSHGQILLPTAAQAHLVATFRANEKVGTLPVKKCSNTCK